MAVGARGAGIQVVSDRGLVRRRALGAVFYVVSLLALVFSLATLLTLLARIVVDGIGWLDPQFLTSYPSRHPEQAGIQSALWGSVWLMGLTGVLTVPLGVGTAIYLEEYAPRNLLTRIIEVNIANLAGVPSIVYGLLGLAVFVQWMSLGRVLLAGALTMALLVLPVVIVASREAIRTVPDTYRQAAFALGATRSLMIRDVVLPQSMPGILTGTILAMSRALGEAAPVIAISALVYMTFVPSHPLDRFTVLPIQIFNWVARPQEGFQHIAAAGILALLTVLLAMNSVAVFLRNRTQRRPME